jgi:hypothetical protein
VHGGLARVTPRVPRRRAGPIEGRPAPRALLAGGPWPLTAASCSTADPAHRFHCGATLQAVEPRGWTNSSAGTLIMTSPEPHRVARTLANHGRQAGRIGSLEPNAGVAPLCPVADAALFVGKRVRRRGGFEALGLAVPPPLVGGGPGHVNSSCGSAASGVGERRLPSRSACARSPAA